MDSGGQYENRRCNPDYYKGGHSMWNMLPQHQIKEQHNALVMNKKIMAILAERDAALQERNEALSSKGEALAARDEALQERDKALAERDNALMERNSALSALHFRENSTFHSSLTCKSVYADETNMPERYSSLEMAPSATIKSKQTKKRKENIKSEQSKGKKVGEDLNRQVASPGKKCKKEWDSYDVGLNLVNFDETTMLVPVCSCTGTAHQCYKWGSGGWQSSCCTTTLSMHPLPQMPNKRHSRMGGRKMSGSVFTKLLSRLAAEGHNLSVPVDLRNYWARHGTNRYITIK